MNGEEMLSFIACSALAGAAAGSAAVMATVDPGLTLYWPATMTRSPGVSPRSITEWPSIDLEP